MVKHVVIIGGGISGLSVAWYLKKHYGDSIELTLYEQSERVGGWIKTVHKEGFLFECGPRSCRGMATLKLAQELGIEESIIHSSPDAAIRYLWTSGQLRKIPCNLIDIVSQAWTWKYIPTIVSEPFRRPQNHQEETIAQFFTRRFSKSFTEQFIDPMIAGIFAGDIDALSMKACFPHVYGWERDHGSVIKGMLRKKDAYSSLFSFKGGIETLIKSLYAHLKEHIHLSKPVKHIEMTNKGIALHMENHTLHPDAVISTVPAHCLASLLKTPLPSLPYRSLAIVHIGYRKAPKELKGFGYLVPRKENSPILGTVWDSSAFPQQNQNDEEMRLTMMMKKDATEKDALEALEKHMGITESPDVISRYEVIDAIPQYVTGHAKLVEQAQSLSPQLIVIGNSFSGVSLNECIESSTHVHSFGHLSERRSTL